MNEEMGLSQMQQQSNPQEKPVEVIQQVVQMIMQGVTPEQLLDMGVPKEVIVQALQMVDQIGSRQELPQTQEGLAGMHTQQGNV